MRTKQAGPLVDGLRCPQHPRALGVRRRRRGEQGEGDGNGALRTTRMIHLPLSCPSRRGASRGHVRRIFTGCRRAGLPHLILRNRFADGGARAGVSRPARMGLVGCDGVPKIAIREQGLFLVKRPSYRCFLSALVAFGTPRHGGIIAPMRFRPASRRSARARPNCISVRSGC